MHTNTHTGLGLLAILVSATPCVAAAQHWGQTLFRARAQIEVPVPRKGNPGVVVAEFLTHGMMLKGDRTLAVMYRTREVPHQVLQVGPGDFCRVAIQNDPPASRYVVYFGATGQRKQPAPKWTVRKGLLLKVLHWKPCDEDDFQSVRQAIETATVLGSDYVPNVFLGHNPFGSSFARYLSVYRGWLHVPKSGRYKFVTSSQDCSFLCLDDKVVVEWPGRHRAVGAAMKQAFTPLDRKVYKFDYYHAALGNGTCAVAAWAGPGAPKDRQGRPKAMPIPADAFGGPILRGKVTRIEIRSRGAVPTFRPEVLGEAIIEEEPRFLIKIKFHNLAKRARRTSGQFRWEFGDGQTSTEAEPVHIYLRIGEFPVKLTTRQSGRPQSATCSLMVTRDWNKQTDKEWDSLSSYMKAVAKYKFMTLDSASLGRAIEAFEYLKSDQALGLMAPAALNRKDLGEEVLFKLCQSVGKALRGKSTDAPKAVAVLTSGAERCQKPVLRAKLLLLCGEILLNQLRDPPQARQRLKQALSLADQTGEEQTVRRAHIRLGDVYRREGSADKAMQHYQAAARIEVSNGEEFALATARRGAYPRQVEEFLRRKELEEAHKYLRRWEWRFPTDKVRGFWSLMQARYLYQTARAHRAVDEVRDVLAINPESPQAVELLLWAGKCSEYLKKSDDARAFYKRILADYPGTEEEWLQKARDALASLDGKPKPRRRPGKSGRQKSRQSRPGKTGQSRHEEKRR